MMFVIQHWLRSFVYSLLLYGIPVNSLAQEKSLTIGSENGIQFQLGSNWKEILKKAKKENKYILVDCYTTWCVPCKRMSEKIFPLKEVGDYVNPRFIGVKIQMDSTKNDVASIKNWYTTARSFEKKYKVDAYPMLLIFSSSGEILHKLVGSVSDGAEFISKLKESEDPGKQYYTLISHYKEHLTDSEYLYNSIVAALKIGDRENATSICDAYIASIKNPFTEKKLDLIIKATSSVKSKGFKLFLDHSAQIDTTLGIGSSDGLLVGVIRRELVAPLMKKDFPLINWDSLRLELNKDYPNQADRVIVESKLGYYGSREMWKEYGRSVVEYMDKYAPHVDFYLNNNAWNVFLFCDEKEVLQRALLWSGKTLTKDLDKVDDNQVDTYANLLYKLGDTQHAIIWESKAIAIAEKKHYEKEIDKYRKTIERFKKGEKVWESPL
jgi:thioredoxin-related protein